MTKTIDPESEDIIQRFTTFVHAFSDIKSLEFPDESIENQLITGFLGSLPDSPSTKGHGPCIGWAIGIKGNPDGLSRKLGRQIYEIYSEASKDLTDAFTTPLGNQYSRPELAPYSEKEDYEIVPVYR